MVTKESFNPFGEITKTSQMALATLNFDWANTELGPIENWDFGLINSLRIVFSCPVGMYCTWGPQRRVFYNDAYVPILKHRHPLALGSRLDEVWPEVWEQVHTIVRKVESGGFALESDVQFDIEVEGQPQGNYYTYGNSPLFNAEGKIAGMLCTILDTTTSVLRTRAALQIAKDSAEKANLAKSAFLANMSHEIRTPLGVILGFSEILGTQDPDPDEKENYLDVILRNGDALTRIIDDILDLSKIEAGKFMTEISPVNLNSLLQEVLGMFADSASGKNIQLNGGPVENAVNDITVMTDPVRVRQVLVNLIGNAVKFTSQGSVQISLQTKPLGGSRKEITFTIKDTGIGMTQEQADKLFQPFTQADVTSTRRFGGTGLGLALSRSLANALGGDVTIVTCTPDVGCTFEFSFQADDAQLRISTVESNLKSSPTNSLIGFRILAVDDSQDNRALIKTLLGNTGLKVTEVKSGEEAIVQASQHHYDLILMDIQMPGLDGFTTLAELRKRGFQGPVIALTAHAMKEDKERALAAGFADHLTKPINTKILLQTLQSYLKTEDHQI